MAIKLRGAGMFLAGLLFGGLAVGVLFAPPGELERPLASAEAPVAPATATMGAQAQADCSFAPAVSPSSSGDGRAALQPPAANPDPKDVETLLVSGKEAAASGHLRDAEVSFLMACRAAQGIQGGDGLPLADAMYQLARHYADVSSVPGAAHGTELLQRAKTLYTASLATYRARHGEGNEHTRFAAQGLATVDQALAASSNAQAAAAPASVPVVAAAPASAPQQAAEAPKPDAAQAEQELAKAEPRTKPKAKAVPKPEEPLPDIQAEPQPPVEPEPLAQVRPRPRRQPEADADAAPAAVPADSEPRVLAEPRVLIEPRPAPPPLMVPPPPADTSAEPPVTATGSPTAGDANQ